MNVLGPRASDLELCLRYQRDGDRDARDLLVERHLGLVRAIVRGYGRGATQIDDLLQVGAIGLVKAIDDFDASRGASLVTYAAAKIRGELKRYFRDHGWALHVERGAKERALRLGRALEDLSASLSRSPTLRELATAAQLSEEEAVEASVALRARATSSVDGLEARDRAALERSTAVEDLGFERTELRALLQPYLRTLSDEERLSLILYYYKGETQSQIAERLGVSQMQVSRLLRRSLARIHAAADVDGPALQAGA
jgi:RNA polymerase sigma-B factor